MDKEEFRKYMLDKEDKDYGICPPPLEPQEAFNILMKHFLGEDWYVIMPISTKQVNAQAVYEILEKYPKKEKKKSFFNKK